MKIAIVGGAKSWVNAPFDDKSWQIWVLGNQFDRYVNKRVARIFEIHDDLSEHAAIYPEWLVSHGIEMIVGEKFPIKNSKVIVFDYLKASALIGENFSSSPAVMMAQAILDEATHISIYGVDMALDSHEYFMQRPCMEQWIGYAKGLGIKVYIDESSPLGYTTYREGRDWPDKGFKEQTEGKYSKARQIHMQRFVELESMINKMSPKLEELKAEFHAISGAMQVYERLDQVERAQSAGQKVNLNG